METNNKLVLSKFRLNEQELIQLNSKSGLKALIKSKKPKLKKILKELKYEEDLKALQIELVKMQQWLKKEKKRVAIIFEGRDAAGKGGAIQRFTQYLMPRSMRVVALPKPTEVEQGQWYFQRYLKQLPNAGEIVFFDRSWYNRAVIEPVMGFCTQDQYKLFMQQVPEFEHMLYEDGIVLIKFWFNIGKSEQAKRFEDRQSNPLKQWKYSEVDKYVQDKWDEITKYRDEMFTHTHTDFSPWIIVKANDKKQARLESMRYVLSEIDYESKDLSEIKLHPDLEVVSRYHRNKKLAE